MPKKKVKKARAPKKSSYGELFDNHPNLKWLLPAALLVVLAFFLVYRSSILGV